MWFAEERGYDWWINGRPKPRSYGSNCLHLQKDGNLCMKLVNHKGDPSAFIWGSIQTRADAPYDLKISFEEVKFRCTKVGDPGDEAEMELLELHAGKKGTSLAEIGKYEGDWDAEKGDVKTLPITQNSVTVSGGQLEVKGKTVEDDFFGDDHGKSSMKIPRKELEFVHDAQIHGFPAQEYDFMVHGDGGDDFLVEFKIKVT